MSRKDSSVFSFQIFISFSNRRTWSLRRTRSLFKWCLVEVMLWRHQSQKIQLCLVTKAVNVVTSLNPRRIYSIVQFYFIPRREVFCHFSLKIKKKYLKYFTQLLFYKKINKSFSPNCPTLPPSQLLAAHPVIILVVMEVIRYQRCRRKRALKAKLYRSLEERRGARTFQRDDTICQETAKLFFRQYVCRVDVVNSSSLTKRRDEEEEGGVKINK